MPAKFRTGLDNTIQLNDSKGFSFVGPWTKVYSNTVMDRFYVGDFASATYFVSVQFDSNEKEAMQVNVVASPNQAALNIVGRTGIDAAKLVDISAVINESYCEVILNPQPDYEGSKVLFSAIYSGTIDSLTPPTATSGSGINTIDNSTATIDNSNVTIDRTS